MGARGRPTPQAPPTGEGIEGPRPRFEDRYPEDYNHPDTNPFVAEHRVFGRELLTADAAWRFRGRWHEAFGRRAPLHIEIGSGNGFFLAGAARQTPEANLLGIELRFKRTVLCGRKIRGAGVDNALVARYHAAFLDDLFEPGALSRIYVNHPDPWPKVRHEKNRLISRWFLEDVVRLLRPGGVLRLKSDYAPNIDQAAHLIDHVSRLRTAPRLPLAITGRSDDVITGPAPWPDDIETNYQSKFRRRGLPVYAIELVRMPDGDPP